MESQNLSEWPGAGQTVSCAEWSAPPVPLRLASGEFHIWRYSLDHDPAIQNLFFQLLSLDERDRAGRFHFELHRGRYICAHGFARLILARYLASDPAAIRFEINAYGKPTIAQAGCGLHFNLSDSAGIGLLGAALGREVGVDVEQIRMDMPHLETARHYFSPCEMQTLLTVEPDFRAVSFFRCWTRKEAYIKAKGRGLSIPLDGFNVSLAPDEPARLMRSMNEPDDRDGWTFWDVEPMPGFAGAAAAQGGGWRMSLFDASLAWLRSGLQK